MSYDFTITDALAPCVACGRGSEGQTFEVNYTSNIGGMMRAAGVSAQSLNGLSGVPLRCALDALLEYLEEPDNLEALVAMEPSNGWGSLCGLRTIVQRLWDESRHMKNPSMEVSW